MPMLLNRCCAALGIWLVAAAVAAGAPLKALIVDGHHNHNWKDTTPLLKKFLETTGMFVVDVATAPTVRGSFTVKIDQEPPHDQDIVGFQPDFAAYDVVVMNYTNAQVGMYSGRYPWSDVTLTYNSGEWPEPTQKALEDYVAGGGGLVIIHGANNAFPMWKQYCEMVGIGWGRTEKDGPYVYWKDGQFVRDTTPGLGGAHGKVHSFPVVVRDREHPITKGLPERFMHAEDELYAMLRGPAKNFAVLATAFSAPATSGSGRNEPVLMTIAYGKGRVFHTALGHANAPKPPYPSFDVPFIVTLQRGTEWAATGKVTQKLPADFPGPDRPGERR